ncbi:GNAT family N-acetyltransferase [Kineothrix sp. MB12-C1]|uniref:GNAT family N-acetyltransferase n=1 Tax=Kineothrix sp. MB12-C1 TaxID=3070215 RepID=UPI0027D2D5AE|nr:GNAT family N-acetyltransferase [Kineothrix sp. MB12-C1]WMC91998.1 GNAT family N-acetyltransferase [Kineothrix sp. MB12-C1]
MIRTMTIEDYEGVYALWKSIKGFSLRSIDDSKESIERFLRRNPCTSVVAVEDGEIVGSILCGNDGRRGCMYHVCVHRLYRRRSIGESMVAACIKALREEGINKVSLIAFTKNEAGNAFWNRIGWTKREDLNYYDLVLNEENIEQIVTM